MKKKKVSHFDPEIFDCFMANLPAMEEIRHATRDADGKCHLYPLHGAGAAA